ncbi:MAG: hypothetical protein IKH26_12105, partial [Bacteroidaceae bacterium]|nr:hypothetical protein [Bacteroidaceae bacterium]
MKHLKLMLTLVVSLFGMNVNAQEASAVGEGQFFLYNVADEAFLTGANDWGTHASLGPQGFYCTLIANGGGYNIKTGTNTTQYLGSNGYVDAGASAWTFTPVEGKTNTYYLYNSGFGYLESTDGSTDLHANASQPTNEHGEWKLFTREALWKALDLSSASETNPLDVSFLIESSCFVRNSDGFSSNQGTSNNRQVGGWSLTANQNNAVVSGPQAQGQSNTGCEFWNNTFDLYQTISVVNGKYIVAFDGFANNTNAVIYGNEVETPFTYTGSNYDFANTLIHISEFATNKSDVITVGNGTLKLGVKRNGGGWCVIDNAHLYYVGGVALDDLIASYEAALAAAQGVNQSAKMNATTLANLQDALSSYSSGVDQASAAALTEATEALNNAASAANASISAYASADIAGYLGKMAGVLELTNVYTTEAYNDWYANIEANYAAGTIPDNVVGTLNANGAYSAGWRVDNHIDDVLLSAWTIGGSHVSDYGGQLYINTWSNEGDSDGSDMTTPFFEYFGGEGSSLEAKAIQATIPDLDPEKSYKVSALVRVRATSDGTTPKADGVTFTAGNSNPMNASNGTQSTNPEQARMYYKTVEAIGKPDASGNLVITFNVNADNLIHWLAFKNVKYEEIDVTPEAIANLYASIQTPHNVQLDAAVTTTKAAVEDSYSVEDFAAFQEAVNAVNASAAEYATVKVALDEADAIHTNIKNNIPATEDALYDQIMQLAIPAYEQGRIESDIRVGSIAQALAFIEEGIRRLVIKQNVNGSVVDRGYPENNLSGTDVTTGNVQVAPDGLAPWMISESRAYTWHVNTWSDEGATDGSGMLTPFLEYWRSGSAGAGLDDVTISNTLAKQNLGRQDVTLYPNSVYEVSGQIRAYMEYTATGDIIGVKIFAGDFESDLSEQASTEVSNNKALIYGTFTVKGNTDANGNLTFGIKTKGTTANWIAAKNFSIKYISNNLDDLYKEAYLKALAKAQTDIAAADYANVGGAELDALQACIDNDPNVPGTVSYKNALESITEANDAFIAAKPAYDTFAAAASTEDPNLQYADPEKKNDWIDACSASPANAEDALA